MPGIVTLVAAIGADVNAQLVANDLPQLVDTVNGNPIPIGMVSVDENSAAPRIVLVPKGSKFGPRSTPNRQAMSMTNPLATGAGVRAYQVTVQGANYSPNDTVSISAPDVAGGVQASATLSVGAGGGVIRVLPLVLGSGYLNPPTVTITSSSGSGALVTAVLAPNPEQLVQLVQRALFTETVVFECHVWGISQGSPGGNQPSDFDAAQLLYQQLIVSAWRLAPGLVRPLAGQWPEAKVGATQIDLFGHYFIFGLEIDTPVVDQPLSFAPPAVRPNLTDNMQSPTGTTETGWSGLG